MIDARIPMMGQQIDAGAMIERAQNMRLRDIMAEQQQQQHELQREEFDFRKQIHQARLDEAQREQARKELGELTVDARAAMGDPSLLPVLQQKWGARGLDLSGVTPESLPQHLMRLDLMGKYLEEAPQPKFIPVEPGGSLYVGTPGGDVRPAILPNPGNAAPGAPAGGPTPGEVIDGFRFRGGNPNDPNAWEEVTGSGQSNFP